MTENNKPVKVKKYWIRKAKKHVGLDKEFTYLSDFANSAFKEKLAMLENVKQK